MAFITFEGIDGCGKSTQLKRLRNNLLKAGIDVIATREPGGTSISEKIRNLLLDKDNSNMTNRCELLMYLAARAQHVEELILPSLNRGVTVLSDRFEEATFAYQGFGRDIPIEDLLRLNTYATRGLKPDLTIILDISIEESERRALLANKVKDRLELSGDDFFMRVISWYKERGQSDPGRILLIPGNLPIEELEQKIFNEAMKVIGG